MPIENTHAALIDLPAGHAQQALKAALTAMNVTTTPLTGKGRARIEALASLLTRANTIAVVDVSQGGSTLIELDRQIPQGSWRERIYLTRLVQGHVSEGDRRWAQRLGFGDFWSDFDARDLDGDLGEAVNAVATAFELTPPGYAGLKRFTAVAQPDPVNAARETLRRHTGLQAEVLATLLARQLEITDRSYHLQMYPSCFVGLEAVAWMEREFATDVATSVSLGQALMELGLLVHVAHDKPFDNANYFYRLATSRRADRINLGEALHVLRRKQGVVVASRNHLTREYPCCWIGSDAVDLFVGHFEIKRHQAWVVGHRMQQFGLFDHVVKARPFIDGHFFYRFADDAAALARAGRATSNDHASGLVPKPAR